MRAAARSLIVLGLALVATFALTDARVADLVDGEEGTDNADDATNIADQVLREEDGGSDGDSGASESKQPALASSNEDDEDDDDTPTSESMGPAVAPTPSDLSVRQENASILRKPVAHKGSILAPQSAKSSVAFSRFGRKDNATDALPAHVDVSDASNRSGSEAPTPDNTINMVSSLNRFGLEHKDATPAQDAKPPKEAQAANASDVEAPAPAKSINMVSSLDRFGLEHKDAKPTAAQDAQPAKEAETANAPAKTINMVSSIHRFGLEHKDAQPAGDDSFGTPPWMAKDKKAPLGSPPEVGKTEAVEKPPEVEKTEAVEKPPEEKTEAVEKEQKKPSEKKEQKQTSEEADKSSEDVKVKVTVQDVKTTKEYVKLAKHAQVAADAHNARIAADTAKSAATVAHKVAVHTVHITEHAKSALKDARDALHKARVDTSGLTDSQRHSLKEAEKRLGEATKQAADSKSTEEKVIVDKRTKKVEEEKEEMKEKMVEIERKRWGEKGKKTDDELEAMRKEIKELRAKIRDMEGDKSEDDATLKELQDQIEAMEEAEKKEDKTDKKSHDEMKAEIERLRIQIKEAEENEAKVTYAIPPTTTTPKKIAPEVDEEDEGDSERYESDLKPMPTSGKAIRVRREEQQEEREATPVQQKGIDIDTAMPYGDLEPFGREDTAQELTEDSIRQSDEMVDQLERAEVSEEKRSVFRALTRLRGAAITSFDGVARTQTGNIDEYNKIHKWRSTHPLHHLADEESDVSKWAFPENAD